MTLNDSIPGFNTALLAHDQIGGSLDEIYGEFSRKIFNSQEDTLGIILSPNSGLYNY